MSALHSYDVPPKPLPPIQGGSDTVGTLNISDSTLHRLTVFFGLLADKSRLRMVLALAEAGEMHVTALCNLLKQTQPAVSHHLTLMRAVGLVSVDRRGKHNYYSLATEHFRDLFQMVFGSGENQEFRFQDWILSFQHKPE